MLLVVNSFLSILYFFKIYIFTTKCCYWYVLLMFTHVYSCLLTFTHVYSLILVLLFKDKGLVGNSSTVQYNIWLVICFTCTISDKFVETDSYKQTACFFRIQLFTIFIHTCFPPAKCTIFFFNCDMIFALNLCLWSLKYLSKWQYHNYSSTFVPSLVASDTCTYIFCITQFQV